MRRVGRVRLTASNEALVRRGALLLEDALRTASLSGDAPGRVLVIRSLPVGIIRGHLPPSSLALTLERRVRELAWSAVHATDASAAHREAVYFHDDAEPVVLLAVRLARGGSVTDWMWPLAVPDFRPGQPREEALRRVLAAAPRTSAGPAAVLRLVEALHEEGGLDVLLAALRWPEGPALLQALGSSPPLSSLPLETTGTVRDEVRSASWRARVTRWAAAWGPGDARSVWLAALALVIDRPGRLMDNRLVERATRLASVLVREGPEGMRPTSPLRDEGSPKVEAPGKRSAPAPVASPSPVTQSERSADPAVEAQAPILLNTDRGSPEPSPESSPEWENPPSRLVMAPEPLSRARGLEEPTPAEPEPETVARPEGLSGMRPTALGGLFFVVPLLERLGMRTLLEEHPALLEVDVPCRLLGLLAERLGAPPTDPTVQMLAARRLGPRPVHCAFALPESLRQRVAGDEASRVFGVEEPPGRHVLTDASGRLPLAVTYASGLRALAPLPPLLCEDDDLDLLLRGLLTAVRRVCRRQAGLGLRDLVCRPARIAATRTHVDVLLDIRQADVRVRGAGLDVDPGWVPWLGQVVRFHYQYEEG